MLGVPLAAGITQSQILTDWANSAGMVTALRPLAAAHSGRALIDGHSIAGYYLHLPDEGWKRWSSTSSLIMPDGKAIGTTVATAGIAALFTRMIRDRTAHQDWRLEDNPAALAAFRREMQHYGR
ncbi:MAG TPA: hypothetical protein VF933_09550 [Streptosporangiaceae bacterium]